MSGDPHHCDLDDEYSDFLEDDAIWDFDPSPTYLPSSPATTLGKRKSPEEEPCASASKRRTISTDNSDEYEPYIIVSFFCPSLSLSESSECSVFLKVRFRL